MAGRRSPINSVFRMRWISRSCGFLTVNESVLVTGSFVGKRCGACPGNESSFTDEKCFDVISAQNSVARLLEQEEEGNNRSPKGIRRRPMALLERRNEGRHIARSMDTTVDISGRLHREHETTTYGHRKWRRTRGGLALASIRGVLRSTWAGTVVVWPRRHYSIPGDCPAILLFVCVRA